MYVCSKIIAQPAMLVGEMLSVRNVLVKLNQLATSNSMSESHL